MPQTILTNTIPSWLSYQGPDCDVVISTRVRLGRNCAHHRFPAHASPHERTLVFDEVTEAFRRPGLGDSFNIINFQQLDERKRQFLIEERLATCGGGGCAESRGEAGVIHDRTGRTSVMVNGVDHIRMQCIDAGCCARELWAELDALDDAVGMQIEYAFDSRFGFLTCRPSEAGTGLRVSFLAHLPALAVTRTIGAVLDDAGRQGMTASGGFSGRPLPAAGSLVQLSKSAVIGSGESGFCDDMAAAMKGIADSERKARERLLSGERNLLTDKISASYGALCGAARLSVEEFLDLSSWLRLGIECTLFDKCTMQDLNRLMLFVLPAHIQTFLKKELDESEIPEARAGLVRSFFAPGGHEARSTKE